MYSFKELRKASSKKCEGKEIRVAILGNCSTQFFATSVRGQAYLSSIAVNIFDADYNQIEMQLIDPSSDVYTFKPNDIIIWLSSEKLYEEFLDMPFEDRSSFADTYMSKILSYWELISRNSKARVIQFNFTEVDDNVLGNYSAKIESTFIYQIRKLNFLLQEAMGHNGNIYPVDLLSIQIQLGAEVFYDPVSYYGSKMSTSTKALPYIAKSVIDVIQAMEGKIKKCLVLDLDNTLWGGVIGDDGIDHIEIGELGRGHVYTNLQRWVKELKEYGIILTICSKNNESIAIEPFKSHEEMVLRLDDISLFVANWNDKASNIKLIQESLNIGMDSLVFIDDNSFERNLVKQKFPEIDTPDLPEDPAQYLTYLQECNLFETASFAGTSSDRTEQYRAEFARKTAESKFNDIDDYLESLEMIGETKLFEESRFSRIAQLTQRSNQFNLRTIRYTEAEIRQIAEDSLYIPLYYTLRDKYGDHGLVSVVILKKTAEHEAFIDTWLMSCRVLKRGMEEYVINRLMDYARELGFKTIKAEYIPTAKNQMVKHIYNDMGFEEISDGQYLIEVDKYKPLKTFIKEV